MPLNLHRAAGATLFMGALAAAGSAVASDGTITFKGAVTAATCTVSSGPPVGGPATFTVMLPQVSVNALPTVGSQAGRTRFNLFLTGCSAGMSNARVFFESSPNVDSATFTLRPQVGSAQNVNFALFDGTSGARVMVGAPASQGTTWINIDPSGNATLPYDVAYQSMGAIVAGNLESSVTYSIEYQ
jgi:major type 1 subunit fimbrin (pilin)